MENFGEYTISGEPSIAERAEIWNTAIGLQATDGLKVSPYLIELAKQNIEGEKNIYEVKESLKAYYEQQMSRDNDLRTEEADEVAARITEILGESAFLFHPEEYINIHNRLFQNVRGLEKIAGKIRDYNITKKEWVLNDETVGYSPAQFIRTTLDYDFGVEKKFNYAGLSMNDKIRRIAEFISGIWQIHPFGEGNTRTTAVFLLKYLRSKGFEPNQKLFTENSWYFRNALVRANYENLAKGIYKTDKYLMKVMGNLLLGENNELKNRDLKVGN